MVIQPVVLKRVGVAVKGVVQGAVQCTVSGVVDWVSSRDEIVRENWKLWGVSLSASALIGVGYVAEVPLPVMMLSSPSGLAVLLASGKWESEVRRRLEDRKELKAARRKLEASRKYADLVSELTPWDAPYKIPIGESQLRIANVLNGFGNGGFKFVGTGQKDSFSFTRYFFSVIEVGNYPGTLYDFREFLSSAAGPGTIPTFSFDEQSVTLDVPKDSKYRVFPFVKDYIGTDRTQLLWPLGVDAAGAFHTLQMDSSMGHVSLTGSTRSGKTEGIRSVAQFWVRRHSPEVIGFAFIEAEMRKNATLQPAEWDGVPHMVAPIAYSYVEALLTLGKFAKEAIARGKEFKRLGVARIEDYNKLPGVKPLARWVCFFDEAEVVLDVNKCPEALAKIFLAIFLEFGREWAAVGLTLVIGVKRLAAGDAEIFPTQLRSVLDWLRICCRVGTIQDSLIATQAGEKEFLGYAGPDLLGSGDCIVRATGTGGLKRYQQLYANERTNEVPVVGGGPGCAMPSRELPTLQWVIETFVSRAKELEGEIAEIQRMIKAADEAARKAGREKVRNGSGDGAQSNSSPSVLGSDLGSGSDLDSDDMEEGRAGGGTSGLVGSDEMGTPEMRLQWYVQYRALRLTGMPMTQCVAAIAHLPNTNSTKLFTLWQQRVDYAIAENCREWIEELPRNLSDDQVMSAIWGPRKGEYRENTLKIIRYWRELAAIEAISQDREQNGGDEANIKTGARG